MPPNGVGGGGVHWNGQTYRFLPSDFTLRTHLTERYGASFIPEDMTIQDWGVTYEELADGNGMLVAKASCLDEEALTGYGLGHQPLVPILSDPVFGPPPPG